MQGGVCDVWRDNRLRGGRQNCKKRHFEWEDERSQLGADVQEVLRAFTHIKVAISQRKDTKVLTKFVFKICLQRMLKLDRSHLLQHFIAEVRVPVGYINWNWTTALLGSEAKQKDKS